MRVRSSFVVSVCFDVRRVRRTRVAASLQLGTTEPEEYAAGSRSVSFSCPSIDLSKVEGTLLNNAAMLQADCIRERDGARVAQVLMVTQIHLDDGKLVRTILSPL